MYKYLLLAVITVSIAISGCGDDDFQILVGNQLSYDGPNNSSPLFPAGKYAAAAHFPIANIEEAIGRSVVSLEFFVYDLPAVSARAVIYEADGTNIPGRELYVAEITGDLDPNTWNVHTLDVPMTITADNGFWVSFEFITDAEQQTIGCDEGPGQSNGDWILFDTDNRYLTFLNRTDMETSINWNIKANLSN